MWKKFLAVLTAATLFATSTGAAYASDFTPSVTAKPAPGIMQIQNSSGATVDAIIRDKNGKELLSVPTGKITVTPYSGREKAAGDIKSLLNTAYQQISTSALSDLNKEIKTYLSKNSNGLKADDLVVRDLFDVTTGEAYKDYLQTDGNTIAIRFNANWPKDAFLMVMINCDILNGDKWQIIPAENIDRNSDGSITVKFNHMCPVLFITDRSQIAIDPNGPDSPQTSDDLHTNLLIGTAVAVILTISAVTVVWTARKRRKVR